MDDKTRFRTKLIDCDGREVTIETCEIAGVWIPLRRTGGGAFRSHVLFTGRVVITRFTFFKISGLEKSDHWGHISSTIYFTGATTRPDCLKECTAVIVG